MPSDLSDFNSHVDISLKEQSVPRIIDTINESDEEEGKEEYNINGVMKSPTGRNLIK